MYAIVGRPTRGLRAARGTRRFGVHDDATSHAVPVDSDVEALRAPACPQTRCSTAVALRPKTARGLRAARWTRRFGAKRGFAFPRGGTPGPLACLDYARRARRGARAGRRSPTTSERSARGAIRADRLEAPRGRGAGRAPGAGAALTSQARALSANGSWRSAGEAPAAGLVAAGPPHPALPAAARGAGPGARLDAVLFAAAEDAAGASGRAGRPG